MKQIFGIKHYVLSSAGEVIEHYIRSVLYSTIELARVEIEFICNAYHGHLFDDNRSVSYSVDGVTLIDSIMPFSIFDEL